MSLLQPILWMLAGAICVIAAMGLRRWLNRKTDAAAQDHDGQIISFEQIQKFIRFIPRELGLVMEASNVGMWAFEVASGQACASYDPKTLRWQNPGPLGDQAIFSAMIHADEQSKMFRLADEAMRERTGFDAEFRINYPGDEAHWARIVCRVICGADQQPRYLIGFYSDITARRRSEEAMRKSNQTLASLIRNAPLGILSTDMELKITQWNPAAERISGRKAQEVIGRSVMDLYPDYQDEVLGIWRRVQLGECVELATKRPHKNGAMLDIMLSVAPRSGPDGEFAGAVTFFTDITAAKRFQQQLLHSHHMESVGRLAGGIAHDFNNLLAVISGYSEALLRRLGDGDPRRSAAVEIEKAAERGAILTRQLLAYCRRQEPSTQILDLNEAVNGVCQMLQSVIRDQVKIEMNCDASPATVLMDRGQVEQIVVNLALNARDAMTDGGTLGISTATVDLPEGSAAATGVALKPGRYVKLCVSDTGIGMDEQTRLHIFEPFFTTKGSRGTGLGLSIVYGIVQECGGNIAVQSRPEQGSQFEVLLPMAQAAASASTPG